MNKKSEKEVEYYTFKKIIKSEDAVEKSCQKVCQIESRAV